MSINVVIDISHHNGTVDFAKVKAAGIVGVIQKCTQGLTYTDPTYVSNRKAATAAGLLWGAYHFATGDDATAQAQHFLAVAQPDNNTLLVLDFEENTGGTSMAVAGAETFVNYVNQQNGRYPGFYSGSYIKQLLGSNSNPTLAKCWFWLSQYGSTPQVPANWPTWTMWQYTDGVSGPQPHSVDGVTGNCDRDQFNGALDQLLKVWKK